MVAKRRVAAVAQEHLVAVGVLGAAAGFAGAAVKRYPTPKVRETQVRW